MNFFALVQYEFTLLFDFVGKLVIRKIRLAYEVTKIVHGEEIANQVQNQVSAAFSNDSANMPKKQIEKSYGNIALKF